MGSISIGRHLAADNLGSDDAATRSAIRSAERRHERKIQTVTVVLFGVASAATIVFAQMLVFAH